jgi:hypothetical protein
MSHCPVPKLVVSFNGIFAPALAVTLVRPLSAMTVLTFTSGSPNEILYPVTAVVGTSTGSTAEAAVSCNDGNTATVCWFPPPPRPPLRAADESATAALEDPPVGNGPVADVVSNVVFCL